MKKRTSRKHKMKDLSTKVRNALLNGTTDAHNEPIDTSAATNPLDELRRIQKYLYEKYDKPQIEKYGAPIRDFMFIFPAFRDDDGALMVYLAFGKVFYQGLELNLDCRLSEFVDGIYRVKKAKMFGSIFDEDDTDNFIGIKNPFTRFK